MIHQDLVDLIRHLLLPLQQNVWYAINPTNEFNPTLNYATNLSEYNYITIFLAADIFFQRRDIMHPPNAIGTVATKSARKHDNLHK
jgi:hypothetical protein